MVFLMCLIKWEENKHHSRAERLLTSPYCSWTHGVMVSFVMERKPARDKPTASPPPSPYFMVVDGNV